MASVPMQGRVDGPMPPSAAYRRMVWLALGALALFVAFYLALCGWFFYNAYSLIRDGGGVSSFWQFAFAVASVGWGIFMLKALFFIQRGSAVNGIEITREQEPLLFEFLDEIADQAKAPRPRRVYLSDRVNAAVSYDLSLLNVLFPSKKNLEIGLGLVNVLTLSEFRAVLAHEFGHFAQRAMAVGRWVYVVHQVAAQIVSRRDRFDIFLNSLSRSDPRIAWVGWIFQSVIWALRALVDTGFRGVYYVQRALGREMEFQADLVSVALCGSDALVHGLYRLQAADRAWDLSVDFAKRETQRNRPPKDIYEIQTRLMTNLGRILKDQAFFGAPQIPEDNRAAHRVFRPEIGLPPKMWSTHPSNYDREVNAKRTYVFAPDDRGSAWALLKNAAKWREQTTQKLLAAAAPSETPLAETLAALDGEFDKPRFRSIYSGAYVNRSSVLDATDVTALWTPDIAVDEAALGRLYPESLGHDVVRLRDLESELASLLAIERGVLRASGRAIQFRGNEISPKHLSATIGSVKEELTELRSSIAAHDRACRSLHLAAARKIGGQWEQYLLGKLSVAHLAAHTEAVLRSAHRDLIKVVRQETSRGGPVKTAGVDKILRAAGQLFDTMQPAYALASQVKLDSELKAALACSSLSEFLGEFVLPRPTRASLQQWLGVIDGWLNLIAGKYSSLEATAFDQLLIAEQEVTTRFRAGESDMPAPAPSQVPQRYQTRPRDDDAFTKKPGLLTRLRDRNGWFVMSIRFLIAAGVFAALAIGGRGLLGRSTVDVYNGLGIPVKVALGSQLLTVQAHAHAGGVADAGTRPLIVSRDLKGQQIESFQPERILIGHRYVYNVAAAAPLLYVTASYGNAPVVPPVMLGLTRWSTTEASVAFEAPPSQIQTKGGGGTVHVVAALAGQGMYHWVMDSPSLAAQRLSLIDTHLRWDAPSDPDLAFWLTAASRFAPDSEALKLRLKQNPDEVLTHVMQLDAATGANRDAQCRSYADAAAANPDQVGALYLASRCLQGADRQRAIDEGHTRFPSDPWFAMSAGRLAAARQQWGQALIALEQARKGIASMAEPLAMIEARIYRYNPSIDNGRLQELIRSYPGLQTQLNLEDAKAPSTDPEFLAYQALATGRINAAVQLLPKIPPQDTARLVRLISGSNGGALIASSMKAPSGEEGIDDDTFWVGLGTALRDKKEPSFAFDKPRDATDEEWTVMQQFYGALKRGVPAQEADKLLTIISPEMRGQAYCLGTIALGNAAPAKWREGARSLLFASERPFI